MRGAALRYVVTTTVLNLVWEIAQLPLYTIWSEGSAAEKIWAVLHCTVGDAIIAAWTLVLAILLFGRTQWPMHRYAPVAAASIAMAVAYTVFSERLNLLRGSWDYAPAMPRIPVLDAGLAPILQWIVVPAIAFAIVRRRP